MEAWFHCASGAVLLGMPVSARSLRKEVCAKRFAQSVLRKYVWNWIGLAQVVLDVPVSPRGLRKEVLDVCAKRFAQRFF